METHVGNSKLFFDQVCSCKTKFLDAIFGYFTPHIGPALNGRFVDIVAITNNHLALSLSLS